MLSFAVRASPVLELPNGSRLWVGGTRSRQGMDIPLEMLQTGLVVDCLGELAAGQDFSGDRLLCVFRDLDAVPSHYVSVVRTARAVADRLRTLAGKDVFVICEFGENRSSLVAALALRMLGLEAADAIARIQQARIGGLSNQRYRRIVEEYRPD